MHHIKFYLLAFLCLANLTVHADQTKWKPINESDFIASTIPRVGELRVELENLEYQSTDPVRAFVYDLNGDGLKDYFIRSSDRLCSQATCQITVINGKNMTVFGRLNAFPVLLGSSKLNGFLVLHAYADGGLGRGLFSSRVYDGASYVKIIELELDEGSKSKMLQRFDGFEGW